MYKYSIFFSLLLSVFFTTAAISQSYYLGKTTAFIKQEKGNPFKTDYKDGQTIYAYKSVSQKGTESLTTYYFDGNSNCNMILQDFAMWFILPWTDELSQKYKRLDKYNWLEKTNIIHAVEVIDEDKFIYIIKYKS